ncbi:hypothetical protein NPIL_205551 [Nephila pilipes]|uniref:Uncharacterized protein n=1 Tax=Nephila pilipes TaxID=299642 RepID=A0A8X6I3W5_NEPPI|nr:hypothetical protein NPIL_205551 [Nephila pilipes]
MKNNPNQTFKKKEEFRKPFPIKKSPPVGGFYDNRSPGLSRTVPRFQVPELKEESPSSVTDAGLLEIFGEKIAVCADTGASHTIAVLPEAKGNKTLSGRDFLNAAGIVLDVQGGKWYFSENPRKQYEFFKKPLKKIAISAFELREDEGKHLTPEQTRN